MKLETTVFSVRNNKKSREPEKLPAKIHTDVSVNGIAAIYISRN